jgi:hypothetical protein
MEDCILALDAAHDKVMVRAIHQVDNPIRLRVKKLQDIRPFYARNAPEFDAEIERWKVECGTLINYRHYHRLEPTQEYDACLLCEVPLFADEIIKLAHGAKSLCVVYRPPIWRAHEELLFSMYPTGKSCKRFIQALQSTKPTKEHASIALACGIPTAGTKATDDDDLAKELAISQGDLAVIRKRSMRSAEGRRYSHVIQLIPRIEPDDKALLGMYQFIKNDLPSVGHIRLARDSALAKSVRFWKMALRALVRSGCVEQRAKTCFYFLDGMAPDYDKIQVEHEAAKGKFTRTVAEVDQMEEFPVRPAQALPSSVPAQSVSSAHSGGTNR